MVPVIAFEQITPDIVAEFRKGLTRLQALVLRVDDIDIAKGAGRIDARTKCLWTYDGFRLTITVSDGALCCSLSSEYDPLSDPMARLS